MNFSLTIMLKRKSRLISGFSFAQAGRSVFRAPSYILNNVKNMLMYTEILAQ